ncbi:MAG: AraC family transcriptional regulator [Clostridia bacterium]|nr:AraC family transcriptional regulator [Clostridia bacterium]
MVEGELFSITVKSGSGMLIPPHFHADSLEFIQVAKGSADITVGLSVIRVAEGGILHLLPGFVHFASSVGEEECLIRVLTYHRSTTVAAPGLDEQFLSLYLLPLQNRTALFEAGHPLHASLVAHMEAAITEWRGKEIFYTAQILSEISHMQAEVIRFYGYREEDMVEYHNMMRIAPTIMHISTSYAKKLRLEALAAQLYLSPDHFGKLFRATVGLTPVEYINTVRVNAALRLLASTDWTIADISAASGFSNSNYFHKVFHDLVGIGPAALRKRWNAVQANIGSDPRTRPN